jgi:hypothetical protein
LAWYKPPVDLSSLKIRYVGPALDVDNTSLARTARRDIQEGKEEPLAHQLLSEAWKQFSSSPRSALVLAVAAIEVGVKIYVTQRILGSEWLIENLPAPPIDKILSQYVELIEPAADFQIGHCSLPRHFAKSLLRLFKFGIR